MVCEFGGSSGTKTIRGSEVSFSLAPVALGYRQMITGSRFDKTLSTTMQICKDPEKYNEDEMVITVNEYREISRWLNRRRFLWFHPLSDEPDQPRPWFRATFTVGRIEAGGAPIGIELAVNTDSPFGFGEMIEEVYTFTANDLVQVIEDKNDEVGIIWPEADILCLLDGTLTISNMMTQSNLSVKNCYAGELLSQSGATKIISSRLNGVNLLTLPCSDEYTAGTDTVRDGWNYSVDQRGIITLQEEV